MTDVRLDAIVDLLRRGASERDGEEVTVLDHGLQCASLLRERVPLDPELHIAGLVHDLGSIIAPGRPATHSAVGADAVRGLLGDRIASLVAMHDMAKRYLVTVDPTYRDALSPRSRETFEEQGGWLSDAERTAFEQRPQFDEVIALRRADDAAKVPDRDSGTLDEWIPVLARTAEIRDERPAP